MRIAGILILAVLVLLAPVVAAGSVVVTIPDVSTHVEGQRLPVDTPGAAPVGVQGGLETEDVDVSLTETRCTVHTETDGNARGSPLCDPGELSTSKASPELVKADLDLLLPVAAPAPAPPADEVAPQAVAVAPETAVPATVLLAAAAAGASLLGAYAVWRVLKWTGLAAFVPLYSHISDNEILEDPNRGAIYRLIQAEPGISTKDIAERLDLAWGTVTHHLGKLEKRRFVVSKKYGKYRRYFANGAGGTQEKDALAVLRLDRTGDVAALIQRQPGMTQKAVSEALGVSSSTILWHVKRLEEVQLVTKVREGKLVRYYPTEGGRMATLIPGMPITAA